MWLLVDSHEIFVTSHTWKITVCILLDFGDNFVTSQNDFLIDKIYFGLTATPKNFSGRSWPANGRPLEKIYILEIYFGLTATPKNFTGKSWPDNGRPLEKIYPQWHEGCRVQYMEFFEDQKWFEILMRSSICSRFQI